LEGLASQRSSCHILSGYDAARFSLLREGNLLLPQSDGRLWICDQAERSLKSGFLVQTGFALANKGTDTRTLQAYLGIAVFNRLCVTQN